MRFLGKCFGVEIKKREEFDPLISILIEDDDFWHEEISFDSGWIDDLILQLQLAKEYLKKEEV